MLTEKLRRETIKYDYVPHKKMDRYDDRVIEVLGQISWVIHGTPQFFGYTIRRGLFGRFVVRDARRKVVAKVRPGYIIAIRRCNLIPQFEEIEQKDFFHMLAADRAGLYTDESYDARTSKDTK